MKTFYIWNSLGIYNGSVELDEDGELLPCSTPLVPPVTENEKQIILWDGRQWLITEDAPKEPEPDWNGIIANKRYSVETAGVDISGIHVDTDDRSKLLINGAALEAMIDPDYVMRWKSPNGFVDLTAQQVIAVARAVRAHVQSCFNREDELLDAVSNGTINLEMIEHGWPNSIDQVEEVVEDEPTGEV